MRFVTYNVRYFGHLTRGLMSTEAALRRIAAALCALDPLPDVIALQEVETFSWRADWGRRRPRDTPHKPQLLRLVDEMHQQLADQGVSRRYVAHYFTGHRYGVTARSAVYTTGLAFLCADTIRVFSRESERPQDITHRRIKALRRFKQTRICAHLHLEERASGTRMDVFNTHLSLPAFLSPKSLRFTRHLGAGVNQLKEVHTVLSFIDDARHTPHVVLVGDFNALPGSPVYQAVLSHGLVDAHAQHQGLDDPRALRQQPSAGFFQLRMRLDHVFASPSLRWLDFDDTSIYGIPGPFDGLSDHVPLIGRVALPPGSHAGP